MSYNQTSLWEEAESEVERLSQQFIDIEARIQKAYSKLVSLKADRGPTNQELADSYAPGETVPVLWVDEAQDALTAMKAVVDATTGPQMDSIRKYA